MMKEHLTYKRHVTSQPWEQVESISVILEQWPPESADNQSQRRSPGDVPKIME